ncbi:transcriptional regulator with XRE-family HTH domain [Actinoplanes octamycinicus]|uniref:Transcriptional regulator with XRE-family HTH domain n=1 Tax=Actinoplanes octamycinicus TaxID=135948 RepID=A0A7W7H3G6_9ACTN|nr:helix-turn-helix domain-containing protein [Actinoplanes octamycinicus]MBB4743099.1 transcriptional regulator with XRE-family HTH domain [Actinoplanes octamycinicus]GIE61339.1 transcriptional regulator [Actinoplanes octamycinicus]
MTTDDVGARIRHLRLAHGLTQRELAAPDYSRTLLAAVESGTRKPSDQMIAHLAVRFGMDQDDLRYGRPPGAVADLEDTLQQARKALSQGKVDHAEDVFRRVHQDATRYALPAPAGWAAYWLGEARLQRGDLRGAEQQFARVRADEHCPPVPRAAALARWAYCRFAGGDAFTATATLQEALRAARESGTPDPDARLRLSTVLLYLFVELDWRERAHDLEADIVGLLPQATRPEWLAHFYTTAGQLRRTPAELPEAERMFGEAGRIYRELGLTREIGLCHWAYGYVLRRVDRLPEAAREFSAAAEILLAVGAAQDHAGATLELAEVRRREGDRDEAVRLAEVAARVSAEFQHVECMAEAGRLLGLVAVSRGDTAEGERLLTEAADRYERSGFVSELIRTCRMLADALIDSGRISEAAAVLRRGLRAAEKSR